MVLQIVFPGLGFQKQGMGKELFDEFEDLVKLYYLHNQKQNGGRMDYFAGHSLGEYNALFAAGAFDFETSVKLVTKKSELMSPATNQLVIITIFKILIDKQNY